MSTGGTSKVSDQSRGRRSEFQAKRWLVQNGWCILAERKSIAGVEVDLLARDPAGVLHIVEVKSKGAASFGIVSGAQRKRLERVALTLAAREPIELVALVCEGERVYAVPL